MIQVKNKSGRTVYLSNGYIAPGGIGEISITEYAVYHSAFEKIIPDVVSDASTEDPLESPKKVKKPLELDDLVEDIIDGIQND